MLLRDALEPEQIQLFKEMAEAYFARPRDKRQQFMVLYTQDGAHLQGNGLLRDGLLWDDLVTLSDSGVFQYEFMTKPKGFKRGSSRGWVQSVPSIPRASPMPSPSPSRSPAIPTSAVT